MPLDLQNNFTGGEIAPSLHARVDIARWHNSLALCKNWFIHAQGGISTRMGMEYINNASDDHNSKVRLIPFEFNTEQTYVLALGNLQMRVIKDGGLVLETDVVISGATQANPAVITATAHGYSNGDYVYIKDVVGMTEINGRFFTVANVTTNTFELQGVDSTSYAAYTSGGNVGRVYQTATPWTSDELPLIKFTQSADVMTLTHPNHGPYDITRNATGSDHFPWPVTAVTFGSTISPPTISSITQVGTASGSANKEYEYVITVTDEQGSESVASASMKSGAAHNALSTTYGNRIQWSAVAGAVFYNVYKLNSDSTGVYGYIGQSDTVEFTDYNLGPDMSVTPPTNNNPFSGGNNPICLTYHQQRLYYGGTIDSPQSWFASKAGVFTNFDLSNPVKSDDSIEYTIASQQVNEIRHLVSMGPLIAFTSGGPYRIDGDADGVITPKTVTARNQGRVGCSNVPPIVAGDNILFVQSLGGRVRDLGYRYESDKYVGDDLSIMAEHLLYGYTIIDWCYAEEPYSLVWVVRNDGTLLSLTYLKDHQVWGWAQHETDGEVESVASIPEGNEDVVYAVVKRTVNGSTVRYIERMHERRFTDINDAFCVDCGLTYEGVATSEITNLHHLEGETVIGLADGNVITESGGSPLVVTDGKITLPDEAEKVHVGLPYTCDLQTLEVNFNEQILHTKKKRVTSMGMKVKDTRGLKVGIEFTKLYEPKERNTLMGYENIDAVTGTQNVALGTHWTSEGRVCIRQDRPLPATILALIPEIDVNGQK